MERATAASSGAARPGQCAALERELALVDEMQDIAEAARYAPDPRIGKIVDRIGNHMCPDLKSRSASPPRWNDRRVIIFTEYEDTRRYLERCLREAISHTDLPGSASRSSPARRRRTHARTSSMPSTRSRGITLCASSSRPTPPARD